MLTVLSIAGTGPALANSVGRCTKIDSAPGTLVMPGGYIFGHTEPAEPGDPCTAEFTLEYAGHAYKGDGHYMGVSQKAEVSYVYSHNIVFALSVFHTYTQWRSVGTARDVLAGAGDGVQMGSLTQMRFDGISGEMFVRVLERTPRQPVAVSLAVEPRWSQVDNLSGHAAEGYGAAFKAMADVVLAERLFAAANATYIIGTQRFEIANAGWERFSAVDASIALTSYVTTPVPFIERMFFGIEARIRSVFEGPMINRFIGNAFFFGPTLNFDFGNERNLCLGWTPQIRGRHRDAPGAMNLDAFERQEFRIKFAAPINLSSAR
jgi:hypothetical protein